MLSFAATRTHNLSAITSRAAIHHGGAGFFNADQKARFPPDGGRSCL